MDINITFSRLAAELLAGFLTAALEQMKEECTVKEAEDPGIQFTFAVLGNTVQQLQEKLS